MRKIFGWTFNVSLILIGASALAYTIHYLIFGDAHHIFIYMIGDLGFLFLDVLLVILLIERLLSRREKRSIMNKLNMVIGTFFSEVGLQLLPGRDGEAEMVGDAVGLNVSDRAPDALAWRGRHGGFPCCIDPINRRWRAPRQRSFRHGSRP